MKRTALCIYGLGITDIHAGAVKPLKALQYLRFKGSDCRSACRVVDVAW